MRTSSISICAAALIAVVAVVAMDAGIRRATAEVLQAPNSIVALDLPDGFRPSARFSGFEHAATGASFVVAELPEEAYASLESGFSAERLAERGMTLVERRTIAREGPHFFAHARQTAAGMEFEKQFLVFRGGGRTVLVSANVPNSAVESGALSLAAIEKVLTSATTRAPQPVMPLFEIRQSGRFKPAATIAGMTQSFTLSGTLGPDATGAQQDAILIVAPSIDKRPVPDAKGFAMKAFSDLMRGGKTTYGAVGPVTIDGVNGYEINATGSLAAEPGYEKYYQMVLVPPGGGYFRIIAMTKGADADNLIRDAKAAAASFALKR